MEEAVQVKRGVYILRPWPALLIDKLRTVVVADLHIGLEEQKEREGIHIPKSLFPEIFSYVARPLERIGVERIVLLGDVKHEFGYPQPTEWAGVKKLLRALLDRRLRVDVVRGNHDNYIISILKDLDIPLHDPFLLAEDIAFFHGHLDPHLLPQEAQLVVTGHEHPSIVIRDDLGFRHRYKAFLSGPWRGRTLLVLPSVSPLALGSDVNELPPGELLSPILRTSELDEFEPYLIDVGHEVRKFPSIRLLRPLAR